MRTLLYSLLFTCISHTILSQVALQQTFITQGNIGKFEKFEAGIKFTGYNFTANPYNPNDIKILVTFTSPSGRSIVKDAFYYKDYIYCDTCLNATYLQEVTTVYPWRVRFAPDETGTWSYQVKLFLANTFSSISSIYSFNCVSSSRKGFVRASSVDSRYLEFSNGESFFPIGANIEVTHSEGVYSRSVPDRIIQDITVLNRNGGNFACMLFVPTTFDFDWNTLGRYDSTQNRAYDLDRIMNISNQLGMYWQFYLMSGAVLECCTNVDYRFQTNPYKTNGIIDANYKFFTSSQAMELYKRKLRYIFSRWGYSTNIMATAPIDEPGIAKICNQNDSCNSNIYLYDNSVHKGNIFSWHLAMGAYIKQLDNNHLLTESIGAALDYDVIMNDLNYDYSRFHFFLPYTNQQYVQNEIAKYRTDKVWAAPSNKQKPYLYGSFYINNDLDSRKLRYRDPLWSDLHSTLWANTFSGVLGSPQYWEFNNLINHSQWSFAFRNRPEEFWRYFKPYSAFLSGINFVHPKLRFKPVANSFTPMTNVAQFVMRNDTSLLIAYDSLYVPNGLDNPNGREVYRWLGLGKVPFLDNSITTSRDEAIEVYALKRDDITIGWVHNRYDFWANLSEPNNTNPILSPTIQGATMTFNDVCNGIYSIEWWNTYYDFDVSTSIRDAVNGQGTVVECFNGSHTCVNNNDVKLLGSTWVVASNNSITVNIPTLKKIDSTFSFASTNNRPDYAFKLKNVTYSVVPECTPTVIHPGYCYSDSWRVEKHVRTMADVNGDGKDDIVAFGENDVWVEIRNSSGYNYGSIWSSGFCYNDNWLVSKHPRLMADVNGDGKADMVAFGENDVWVALSTGNGFLPSSIWSTTFCFGDGWKVDIHERYVQDVNGDNKADIVGFGDNQIVVALSLGDSFSSSPVGWSTAFCGSGWNKIDHTRTIADVNGDGKADAVGFGENDVWVALSNGNSFQSPSIWSSFYCKGDGWNKSMFPSVVSDVNGDGSADIVGFGGNSVYISLSFALGFSCPQPINVGFGYYNGNWRTNSHVRLLADIDGDSRNEIVGFGQDDIYGLNCTTSGNFFKSNEGLDTNANPIDGIAYPSIYPVPISVGGVFSYSTNFSLTGNYSLCLYDMLGVERQVFFSNKLIDAGFLSYDFSLNSDIKEGVYIICLKTPTSIECKKVVIK